MTCCALIFQFKEKMWLYLEMMYVSCNLQSSGYTCSIIRMKLTDVGGGDLIHPLLWSFIEEDNLNYVLLLWLRLDDF